MRRWLGGGVLVAVVAGLLGAWPAHAAPEDACPTRQTGVADFPVGADTGYVARVAHPTAIVVFFHGIGHTACSWASNHLGTVATQDHVIAVAMDYPRWQVQEGADASVAAAKALLAEYPGVKTVIAYGVSMGGNASGLAVADKPVRADGSPLWSWWIDVEGATNVIETYAEASALAPANDLAANAKAWIEEEMGGPLGPTTAASYAHHDVVARAGDVAASGIGGVIVCHGVDDGLVPYDQNRELKAALQGHLPVDFTTFVTKTAGTESGTTIDGYAPVPHDSPFAGHANEDSVNQDVGNCGFTHLAALLTSGVVVDREVVHDGATGQTVG